MAERLQVAVVAVTHSAKAKSKKAIHSFIDSIAFAATARGAFLVLRDNEDKSRRLFLKAKMNIGPEPEGLAFRLVPAMVGPNKDIPTSLLTFEGEFVDKTADEVIAALSASSKTAARDKAKDFLLQILADHKLVSVTEVQRQAEAAGLKYRTICTAKAELGVQSEKGKGDDSHWYWVLR